MGTGRSATPPTDQELLERSEELDAIRSDLAAVADTDAGRLILISGEAGIGKTSLLMRFAASVGSTRVLWGSCDSLKTPRPLGPLVDIAEQTGGELAISIDAGAAPSELLAVLFRELRRRRSVVVLEDVHWADQATLDLLRLLSRRISSVPALVIVSYRDDELDRAHPLQVVLGELASTRPRRLSIAPLSRGAVAQLAGAAGVDATELFGRTAGNPFFVTEALAAGDLAMPDNVRDVVLARAARLSDPARRLLDAVAVAPPRAELWLLEEIAEAEVGELESCLASGMLRSERDGVAFRHEIARAALDDTLPPTRALDLHRAVLRALRARPETAGDLARLAHHAEAAGDADAVHLFAPAAAERAASVGAHREAAAQLARALRFAAGLPGDQRAELLERRSYECYLTGEIGDAVEARRQALSERRERSDRLREGDSERWLSRLLWFAGDNAGARAAGRRAVALLEPLPETPELAMAYSNLAQLGTLSFDLPTARRWGERAVALAERLHNPEILSHALNNIGTAELDAGVREGAAKLERSLALALEAGLEEHVARAYTNLGSVSVMLRDYAVAERYLEAGIGYCFDRDLDTWLFYMTGWQARSELEQGRFETAAELALTVTRRPRVAAPSRITPLLVLGQLRARRGDPDAWALLDEAAELARGIGEIQRLAPVAIARAEARWLAGEDELVDDETGDALALALSRDYAWAVGDLSIWRRRAGTSDPDPVTALPEPYRLELSGDCDAAARAWSELGCPYEAAIALQSSPDEELLRRSLSELQRLGAGAAAARVTQALRRRGVRGIRTGPRSAARENEAGLTARELEVLELVAEGMRNADIAERLVVSRKTIDHHVSAILGKLGAASRTQAVAEAGRRGILEK